MSDELKRSMKLIWGGKKYKKVWRSIICIAVVTILCLAPGIQWLVEGTTDEFKNKDFLMFTIFPMFIFMFFGTIFENQTNLIFSNGKGMLSYPFARCALTKGLLVSRLSYFIISVMSGLFVNAVNGLLLKQSTVGLVEEILLGYVVVFAILQACGYPWNMVVISLALAILSISPIVRVLFFEHGTVVTEQTVLSLYEMKLPLWLAVLLFVIFLAIGVTMGYFVLQREYKKRSVSERSMMMLYNQNGGAYEG